MKRLTERTEYGIVGNNDKVTHYPLYKVANNDPLDHGIVDKCFNKLANYEDLEEQGLLLKLPCKVGDTVYRLVPKTYKHIEPLTVREFAICNDGFCFRTKKPISIIYVMISAKQYS